MLPVVLACGSSWALTRKRASAGRLSATRWAGRDRLAHLGPGQGDHRLAGADHLPGLGVPGGDDAVEIGHQARVESWSLACCTAALAWSKLAWLVFRRVRASSRRAWAVTLRANSSSWRRALAWASINCLGAGQVALAGAQLVLLVGGVEGCQQRALPTKSPTSNRARGDPSVGAEAEHALVARLDAPGEATEVVVLQGLHGHRQHRRGCRRRLVAAAGESRAKPNRPARENGFMAGLRPRRRGWRCSGSAAAAGPPRPPGPDGAVGRPP